MPDIVVLSHPDDHPVPGLVRAPEWLERRWPSLGELWFHRVDGDVYRRDSSGTWYRCTAPHAFSDSGDVRTSGWRIIG